MSTDRAHELAAEYLSGLGRRWEHVRTVGRLAELLAAEGAAGSDVVAAAWLHDLDHANELTMTARWREKDLVFPSASDTVQDGHNVLCMFRDALALVPGIDPTAWSPRDLRHSFVSILSQHVLPLEDVSRLMGHPRTAVTELLPPRAAPRAPVRRERHGRRLQGLKTARETPTEEATATPADLQGEAASDEA